MLRGRTVVHKHTVFLPFQSLNIKWTVKICFLVYIVYISTMLYCVSYAALYLSDG